MRWEDQRRDDRSERVKSLPGKKNTREWCRGKVGRHHEVEIRLNPQIVSMNERAGRPTTCHWFAYSNEKLQPERGIWICHHQIRCVNCGKILNHSLGSDCSDRTNEYEAGQQT